MHVDKARSPRRHAPLAITLVLVACGSGSNGGTGTGVPVVNSTASPITPTPLPTATPTPTPTAQGGGVVTTAGGKVSVLSPSLAGLDPIASNIDVSKYVGPSWGVGGIPITAAPDVMGAFRFLCAPSHNAYDDPIVYPGQPGKSHLHTFFGNSAANASSTYSSLRTSGDSSCGNLLNRSAYWIPAMMNGAGKVVMPDYVSIYYKRLPANSPACSQTARACLPLPRGLRYVFGFNMTNPSASSPDTTRYWNCDGSGAIAGRFATITAAVKGCPSGARLGAVLNSPDCWNGTELDTPDHRSHMAYMVNDGGIDRCPATHPYLLPTFTIGAWYTNDGTAANWYLSSDRMSGMPAMEPGSTLHADWFGAWEDSVLSEWTENCINQLRSCVGGELGDGKQIKPLAVFAAPGLTTLVDPPALVSSPGN